MSPFEKAAETATAAALKEYTLQDLIERDRLRWPSQNAVANSNSNHNQQSIVGVAGQAIAEYPSTLLEQIGHQRASLQARDEVLTYIEAQINMKLFGQNKLAQSIYERAMQAACTEILKCN